MKTKINNISFFSTNCGDGCMKNEWMNDFIFHDPSRRQMKAVQETDIMKQDTVKQNLKWELLQ